MENRSEFVVDLLNTLRADRFSPQAWGSFLVSSWVSALATARTNPALVRSWRRVTLLIGVLMVALVLATRLYEGDGVMVRLLPGLIVCVAWQQSDLFWHLGLNRSGQTGVVFQRVGLANMLTWLRALAASYLIGRLIGGLSTPSGLALAMFLFGIATDILDGLVARAMHTQSRLGQLGDAEGDFCLSIAVTAILVQNAMLPLWLGIVTLLRFLAPLFVVLGSYFLLARPVRMGSTSLGRYTGVCQCAYFLVVLAPAQLAFVTRVVQVPLLITLLVLLIIAPVAQWLEHTRFAA